MAIVNLVSLLTNFYSCACTATLPKVKHRVYTGAVSRNYAKSLNTLSNNLDEIKLFCGQIFLEPIIYSCALWISKERRDKICTIFQAIQLYSSHIFVAWISINTLWKTLFRSDYILFCNMLFRQDIIDIIFIPMHYFLNIYMVACYSGNGHFIIYLSNLMLTFWLFLAFFATRSTTPVFVNSSLANCLLSSQTTSRNGIVT